VQEALFGFDQPRVITGAPTGDASISLFPCS
jgi:hypothetical protein